MTVGNFQKSYSNLLISVLTPAKPNPLKTQIKFDQFTCLLLHPERKLIKPMANATAALIHTDRLAK